MVVDAETYPRAEETLRLLAAAAGSARLYPPSSALPAEAVARFTQRSNEITASGGPLRYAVDPDGFRIGDEQIAPGNQQIASLARSLHALQVGQVVIAPGLSDAEATAFVTIANAEPAAVRAVGGPRTVLGSARVNHIAVVEVSLRASEEEGLEGDDLLATPLDELATHLAAAAGSWAETQGAGGDKVARVIEQMETATRDIAVERVAAALLRLDEATRVAVLAAALRSDCNGQRMEGMLEVVAKMKPAALARLLTLAAAQAGTDPNRIAAALPLSAESGKRIAGLLAPRQSEDAFAGKVPNAGEMAAQMATAEDAGDLARQVAVASPQLSSGRALATAVAISRAHPNAETVRAIAETLPHAARDGALPTVREALRRLDELAQDTVLTVEIAAARASLSDPRVLTDVCSAIMTDADAAIVGELLQAAGPAGAEALLDLFIKGNDHQRSLLRPALRGMSESILGVARQRLRNEERDTAVAIIATLQALGDRRAVPVIAQAFDNLDEQVRFSAITALADSPAPEAANALIKALGHPEPTTQRFAIREIGRVKAAPAVHQLTRALEDLNVIQRTYETKREVIGALEQIATPEAMRALRRAADGFAFSRRSKELRMLARRALRTVEAATNTPPREGVE